MPMYIYKCPKCDAPAIEVGHKMTETFAENHFGFSCTCGAKAEDHVKQIQPVPSVFKGGGWAADGYAAKTGNPLPTMGGK